MTTTEPYAESLRPQFHFTAKTNWLNDPNGMVYHNGEYHLFFQHNPEGLEWGNMTWGHAVSKDMIHWEQLPHAIHPDELGTIFSGSAVVDHDNTAGFQTGDEPPIVACFTYSTKEPGTQALAYSNDNGRTFTKYSGNPVVPNITGEDDRDPKLLWHEKTKQWVMVLYLDGENTLGFFTSNDLKTWVQQSTCGDFHECPDLFELPVDGDPDDTRWVLHGAAGSYLIGSFDGKAFVPECERKLRLNSGFSFYAAQSFSNMPDDRRVQIAWMQKSCFPGMPFNQQLSFPCALTLRTTADGIRMYRWPVKEIESLYAEETSFRDLKLSDGDTNPLADISGDLFDIEAVISVETAKEIGIGIRGQMYAYDVGRGCFYAKKKAPLAIENGKLKVRILVDRGSIELFANDGLVTISDSVVLSPNDIGLDLYVRGGSATVETLVVRELKSAW